MLDIELLNFFLNFFNIFLACLLRCILFFSLILVFTNRDITLIELAVPENSRPFELAAFQISRAALVPNKSLVSVTSSNATFYNYPQTGERLCNFQIFVVRS